MGTSETDDALKKCKVHETKIGLLDKRTGEQWDETCVGVGDIKSGSSQPGNVFELSSTVIWHKKCALKEGDGR